MKKRTAVLMFVLISALNVVAQTSTTGNYERRTSKPFHHIKIDGELKVKLVHSDEPLVEVYGSPYQIDNTVTMLKSDTLFVFQSNIRNTDLKVKVIIYADEIAFLDVKGKTTVDCSGFNKEFLGIRTREGAEIRIKAPARDKSMVMNKSIYDKAAIFAKWTPEMNIIQ